MFRIKSTISIIVIEDGYMIDGFWLVLVVDTHNFAHSTVLHILMLLPNHTALAKQ